MKKKPFPPTDSGQVKILKQGYVKTRKMQSLINEVIDDIDTETPSTAHPVTMTQGDNWICISAIMGQVCINIRFMQLNEEGGRP